MERYTSRNESGDLMLCGEQVYGNNQSVYNALSELEEYEDTGLAPEEVPHWIPVSERLPEPGKRVLMCMDGKSAYEGFIHKNGKWDRYGNPVGTIEELFGCSVTHWMPLPAGPKENEI